MQRMNNRIRCKTQGQNMRGYGRGHVRTDAGMLAVVAFPAIKLQI